MLVNGKVAKLRQTLREDDVITVYEQPAPEDHAFVPQPVETPEEDENESNTE